MRQRIPALVIGKFAWRCDGACELDNWALSIYTTISAFWDTRRLLMMSFCVVVSALQKQGARPLNPPGSLGSTRSLLVRVLLTYPPPGDAPPALVTNRAGSLKEGVVINLYFVLNRISFNFDEADQNLLI
ncbi:hypothetical protein KIN20_034277 [Parelaphostrongylus tenuis]|uniref:Uncharacterized protein n=1 Tax=Parelaphostrongylus tenuis TaxID=148309 RepID=A0AAD5WJ35_PARTN|nr:hypothetical protein KIN20_034277 [Parelaphostrongylus tenuis]